MPRIKNSNTPEWVGYLEDFFGVKMYGDKHERWLKWMSDSDGLGSEPNGTLILNALKFAYDKGKIAGDKFTVDRLMMWIRWYRKESAVKSLGTYPEGSREARLAKIKQLIRNARSWTERWNYLCEETKNIDECHEIEHWARREWPQWDEKMKVVRGMIIEADKEVWQNIGAMKDINNEDKGND